MRTKRSATSARVSPRLTVRDRIFRAMDASPLRTHDAYLTYKGILPIDFPDGTYGVITPDLHVPAHNKGLFAAYLQFLGDFKPHVFLSIGDWNDIFGLSRHPKGLRVPNDAQAELDEGKRCWDEAMDISQAFWGYLILGNHEDRIRRYLDEFCQTLGRLVMPDTREPANFHSLMGFKDTDNTTILYGNGDSGGFEGGMVFNSHLNLHHGSFVRPTPGASPLADMDRWIWTIGHGHTHRMGMNVVGDLQSYEFGHMVDVDHAYMGYAHKMFPNWAPGFAVFFVHGGKVHVQPVPIQPILVKGVLRLSFVWGGKVYSELDR